MKRLILTPVLTADGRHLILRAELVSTLDRIRAFLRRR